MLLGKFHSGRSGTNNMTLQGGNDKLDGELMLRDFGRRVQVCWKFLKTSLKLLAEQQYLRKCNFTFP